MNSIMEDYKTEKLIELVRQHRLIYDMVHPKYSDNSKKVQVWAMIGQELDTDPKVCKARWTNIRDQFRKALKKSVATNGFVKLYKYHDQLTFLTPFEKKKKESQNSTNQEEYEDDMEAEESNHSFEFSACSNPHTEMKEEPVSPTEMVVIQNESLDRIHSIDTFLQGLGSTLKLLSPLEQNRAKTELFQIVQKYEMRMLTNNHDCSSCSNQLK